PSGRTKNFMIWQYLKQDISPKEADSAYALVEGNIAKVKKAYLEKSKNKVLLRESECRGRRDLLDISDKDCFILAMSPYKTLNMDDKSRAELIGRLKSKSARDAVKIQAEAFNEEAYKKYEPNTILDMFIRTNRQHRRENLNISLSKEFLKYMFSKEASAWKKFALIKIIVNDDKLDVLQKSILNIDASNVGSDSNFLLALNHLKHGQDKQAIEYFEVSKDTYTRQMSKDKNSFWMYQVSKEKKYLQDLALSMNINIYSLYGKEKLAVEVTNYFSSVETIDAEHSKNLSDPFMWDAIAKEIKITPKEELLALAATFKQKDMAPVQSFIIEKAYAFKMHGYITPYDEFLEDVSTDDKALIYALMRQESNLIPSALSRSFALGLMQIMPFVTDDLSKRMDNPISSYNDMFKPEYNLPYALKHFAWLKKTYYHPLFLAYAYNGGLTYFRRHLEAGTFKKGAYEPFMSMELMSNKESREYGKRVLANYVMYKKILGEDISIVDLLNNLTDPMKTDRYRSAK
ncbi:MAG: lytic transglycosylase domain-containing protein, partial [Sulfurimonas sp.]|nr:lytic transglycosylase domain-containing protein [Sulfurimonas sp.]